MELLSPDPWQATLFIANVSDGRSLVAGIDPSDQDWFYGEFLKAFNQQELAHRWRARMRVRWENACHEVWSGSDFWVVEECFIDDPPGTGTIVLPLSVEVASVEVAVVLELYSSENEPVLRAAWSAEATLAVAPGTYPVALKTCAFPDGLPFRIPEPEIRMVEPEVLDAWIREVGEDKPPRYAHPRDHGSYRRDPRTGREAIVEAVASEDLGSPMGLVTVLGPIPEQALVPGDTMGAELGFVPEGIVVRASKLVWLVPHGARVAQRVAARQR